MNDDEKPVTRGELRAELDKLATKEQLASVESGLQRQFETFATQTATKSQFETFAAQLTQVTQRQFESFEARMAHTMQKQLDAAEGRLAAEIARTATAGGEQTRHEIGVLDDRYRDLPGRVALLERELDDHRRDAAAHRPTRSRRRPT